MINNIIKKKRLEMLKRICLIIFTVMFSASMWTVRAELPRSGEDFSSITDDGVWTWYGEPKAIYHEGEYRKTYMGWINGEGAIEVGSFNHDTREYSVTVINPSYTEDDHNHPVLWVRPDERIMVFYTGHNGQEIRVHLSDNPEDISSFGPETRPITGTWYCYPNIAFLSEEADSGRLYVFFRGIDNKPCYAYSDDWGETFSDNIMFYNNDDDHGRPYSKYCHNGKDEWHVMIEEAHRAGFNPIYYLKYKDGNFYDYDGTLRGDTTSLPIINADLDTVHYPGDYGAHGTDWDIELDDNGYPVLLYDQFQESEEHIYWYFRWTGTEWFKKELVNSGNSMGGEGGFAGGLTLDHENPNILYMSRELDGTHGTFHEIEQWITYDEGETWETMLITQNSENKNCRPCVPRGHDTTRLQLMWLYGTYTAYGADGWHMAVNYLDTIFHIPGFRASPSEVSFSEAQDELSASSPAAVTILNRAPDELTLENVSASTDVDWVTLSFSDNEGNEQELVVELNDNAGSLGLGTFSGTITLNADNVDPKEIPLELTVSQYGENIALGRTAGASSVNGSNGAAAAVDGDPDTRWESEFEDNQWISVDLGQAYSLERTIITWQNAAAEVYAIQLSTDNETWTTIDSVSDGSSGETRNIELSGEGRYLRIYGYTRTTGYGQSIYEWEVYGEPLGVKSGFSKTDENRIIKNQLYMTGSRITVNGSLSGRVDVDLLNCAGKKILSRSREALPGVNFSIDIGEGLLSQGVYLVRVRNREGCFTRKIFYNR